MRILFAFPLFVAVVLGGCAHKQEAAFKAASEANLAPASSSAVKPAPAASSGLIVTPGKGLTAKVARYNEAGRFVVLEFPVGHLPSSDQRLFVYRSGLKVGEVKVTTWQKDVYVVADLTEGEAQVGDEVRDK